MECGKVQSNGCDIVDLHHGNDGNVFVHPADYDAFMLTQREATEALRTHKTMMSTAQEMKQRVDNLLMDISKWAKQYGVVRAVWGPRPEEGLFAFVAPDEDDEGTFQDLLAEFELEMSSKYQFQLAFMMFRISEAEGVDAFIAPEAARVIYSAPTPSSSG